MYRVHDIDEIYIKKVGNEKIVPKELSEVKFMKHI